MKRNEVIVLLKSRGCEFYRHGSNHDIYIHKTSGKKSALPRHKEIAETLVKLILKQLDIQE